MADETAQGVDIANALTGMERKSAAFNALAKVYGPSAGDPDLAAKLQENQYNALANPAKLAQMEAQTGLTTAQAGAVPSEIAQREAQTGLTTAQAGAIPSEIAQREAQTGLTTAQAGAIPSEIAQREAQTGLTTAQAGAIPSEIAQREAQTAEARAAAEKAANTNMQTHASQVLSQAIARRDSGLGAAGALDVLNQIKPEDWAAFGVDPAHVEPFKAQVAANPKILDQVQAAMQSSGTGADKVHNVTYDANGNLVEVMSNGQTRVLPTVSGVFSQKTPEAKGAAAAATAKGTAEGKTAATDIPLSQTQLASAKVQLQQKNATYDRLDGLANDAAKLVSPTTTGLGGAIVGWVPGSSQRLFESKLQTLRSAVAIQTASAAREASKTGAPPVAVRNYQEFKAYQDFLGTIDPSASPAAVKQQIAQFRQSLATQRQGANDAFKAATSTTPAAAAPATKKTYTYNPKTGAIE